MIARVERSDQFRVAALVTKRAGLTSSPPLQPESNIVSQAALLSPEREAR